jgi:trehalose synthase
MKTVPITPEPLDRFASVLDIHAYERLLAAAESGRGLLSGRVVWNVSSTSRGGGVAEMLIALLPLARGAGADVRWLVIRADDEFFRITKRVHNQLHGTNPDAGELGPRERAHYEAVLRSNAQELGTLVSARDIVILHDPQTAGLAPAVRRLGAKVVWRCHIGADVPDATVRRAWAFLEPYLMAVDGFVFSRREHAWDGIDRARVFIIPPSIDIFSPKNEPLGTDQISGILAATGIVASDATETEFVRLSGAIGRVTRRTDLRGGTPLPPEARFITHISRWDRLKDPQGLALAFVEFIAPSSDAHLIIAGPAVGAVADDPEGAEVLSELWSMWTRLPLPMQLRIHLACLPMVDVQENAIIVNALQRRASVVVQKSLAEGFGLTVAEAMWKARPIVASRVGGIQDQLTDGVTGMLVNPTDLPAFGQAVLRLLDDPSFAAALGKAGHVKCREEYLAPQHLTRYVRLIEKLLL